MNATEAGARASATLRATVDFPEPVPPAIPITRGRVGLSASGAPGDDDVTTASGEAGTVSRSCIGKCTSRQRLTAPVYLVVIANSIPAPRRSTSDTPCSTERHLASRTLPPAARLG